jgi:hypothetical protein
MELAGRLDTRTMATMTHTHRSILAGLALAALTIPSWNVADASNDIKDCYNVYGEARYGALAYKHVVIVQNRCDVSLACKVWTDVDPEPRVSLNVGPKGTGEAITRNNSPARSFKAFGECEATK